MCLFMLLHWRQHKTLFFFNKVRLPMSNQKYFTTNEVAKTLGVQGSTVRRGLCINGHYMGIVPVKLPNNRLLWPESGVNRLLPKDGAEVTGNGGSYKAA
jgi:hypothetical protein